MDMSFVWIGPGIELRAWHGVYTYIILLLIFYIKAKSWGKCFGSHHFATFLSSKGRVSGKISTISPKMVP